MEIGITGVDPTTFPEMAAWHWHIALYLFLGGLVAGIMIISAVLRLRRSPGFDRGLRIAEISAVPLACVGLFALFLDLGNGWNAWRFFATFQVTSAMSWGSWILLFAMIVLVVRATIHTQDLTFRSGWWTRPLDLLSRIGRILGRKSRAIDYSAIVLGIALGAYTGILLSTIPARPLWDSMALAPLFLVSGLTVGGAFICLFLEREPHLRLVPLIVTLCAVELALIAGFMATLLMGPAPLQAAGELLLGGRYALGLWGGVVVLGLLVPVSIEIAEVARRKVPPLLSSIAPYLKMSGGLVLRFVIVYAGVASVL
ncbi:MAG: polysulfide reductase [Actinobacteria bacterium]|nr:MAG: polysulfide reductase [Actinomycetota bacterium]